MIKSSRLSTIFLCSLALTLPFISVQAAYLKNGVLNFAIGEKEDPAQSNTYVKVVKRSDGSAQVFYYDPDAGNKFVQKTIPAGQTLKISYWNSSGQRIKQEIRTSGDAAAPEIASTAKAQARPQATPNPKESNDSSNIAAKPDLDSGSPSTPISRTAESSNSSLPPTNSSAEKESKSDKVEANPPALAKADGDFNPAPVSTPTANTNPIAERNSAEKNPTETSSNTVATDSSKPDIPKGPEAPVTASNSAPAANSAPTNQPIPETKQTQNTTGATQSGTTAATKADDSDPFSDGDDVPPQSAKPQSTATPAAASTTNLADSTNTTASPSAATAPATTSQPQDMPTSSTAAPAPANVASTDIPKFDPFALIPTMKSSPGDTPSASGTTSSSASKAIITPVATSGDSFIKATDTNLGPCVWRKFSIKVYMDPAPGATSAQLESEVKEAFDTWTKVTGNKIRFEFGPKQGADITITWTPTTAGFRDPSEAGESSVDYSTPPGPKRTWDNPGNITHAKVKLSTTDINHKEWQAGQFKLLVLHEIGHALGIFGHSNNANDIMYTLKGAPSLSPRDINTVNILYKAVSGN